MTVEHDHIKRHPERSRDDRANLNAVLDDGHHVGSLSTVVDGVPWVVPMLYARVGDRILLHGSTGAGALRYVAAGARVALCVTHVDGWIYAHSLFESSANYRSAVVHGTLARISGPEAAGALTAISDVIFPGRSGEVPRAYQQAAGGHASPGHGHRRRPVDRQDPERPAKHSGGGR